MNLRIRNTETGTAIILVISVLAVMAVIVGVAIEYTTNIGRYVQRSSTLQRAIAVGDGSLETLFGYWRETCRMNTSSSKALPTSSFTSVPLPTGGAPSTQFPDILNFTATASAAATPGSYTVSNYQVQALDPTDPTYTPIAANASPSPALGRNSGGVGVNKDKLATATYTYLASADVNLPALRGYVTAKVRRLFEKQQQSPWNFAIFYVDPLEIHPGPQFNVTGPVHTNGSLYTAHSSLAFLAKATFATDWKVGFAPGDPRDGVEVPTKPSYPANLPPALDNAQQPFGLDSTRLFNPTDGNPNNDSYHELVEKPIAGSPDPLAGLRYYDQACLVIDISPSNAITIRKNNGDGTYTTVTATSASTADKNLYSAVNASLSTMPDSTKYIKDNREGTLMRLTTLDVATLNSNAPAILAGTNWNGIIYLSDGSPTAAASPSPAPSYKPGIRLKNGASVPIGGLTIASNNPVYIQGDYNTGTTGVNSPPSNYLGASNDPTKPEASGYSRQPCAVIADAVNILSNSWNDANASGGNATSGLGLRIASNTTVNAAIVSGIVPTSTGSYSGGAENFPRFLEDWSKNTKAASTTSILTYYGSMVELYSSVQSKGIWPNALYVPPVRHWYFDTNFEINSPPGSLMVYNYVKGKWWVAQ